MCQEYNVGGETVEKPVYFLSHKLSKSQTNWATVEKECFALVYSLEKLHYWVSCSQIVAYTDHKPLVYLLTSAFKNKKIAAWQSTISEYNIDIKYLPGEKNCIADLLSRRPNDNLNTDKEKCQTVPEHVINHIDSTNFDPSKYVNQELPLFEVGEKPTLTDLDAYQEQQWDENIVFD